VDFRAALLDQTRDFGELIRSADPSTPVPTCPDWTLRQLLRHVGRGNRWAAQIIADRRTEPLDPRDVRDGKPPALRPPVWTIRSLRELEALGP